MQVDRQGLVASFAVWLIFCGGAVAQLAAVPLGSAQVRTVEFATGLPAIGVSFNVGGPTDLAEIPNGTGNLLVSSFGGEAFLFSAAGVQQTTPFLDLRNSSSPSYDSDFAVKEANGLTSVAFHPEFATSTAGGYGKFYTLEAQDNATATADFPASQSVVSVAFLPHQQVLFEYTLASHLDTQCAAACVGSKREVMRVDQPGWHHNMGDLQFDNNGLLYVSSGDGSTAGTGAGTQISDNSQLLSNVYGKILRIDPLGTNSANGEYGIPTANPFVAQTGLDEIYAYGLRNPYRLSMDSVTGDLYASETGENSIESVERIVSAANYGWNLKEGSYKYDKSTKAAVPDLDANSNGVGDLAEANGLTDPILEYGHVDGFAVVGGVAYRGSDLPGLYGNYVFGDFSGKLFYGDVLSGTVYGLSVDTTASPLPQIWSINQNANGEIFVLGSRNASDGSRVGHIVKLVPVPEPSALPFSIFVMLATISLLRLRKIAT